MAINIDGHGRVRLSDSFMHVAAATSNPMANNKYAQPIMCESSYAV